MQGHAPLLGSQERTATQWGWDTAELLLRLACSRVSEPQFPQIAENTLQVHRWIRAGGRRDVLQHHSKSSGSASVPWSVPWSVPSSPAWSHLLPDGTESSGCLAAQSAPRKGKLRCLRQRPEPGTISGLHPAISAARTLAAVT